LAAPEVDDRLEHHSERPVGDDICNVCGWDMLDQYREPDPAPAGQEDRSAS